MSLLLKLLPIVRSKEPKRYKGKDRDIPSVEYQETKYTKQSADILQSGEVEGEKITPRIICCKIDKDDDKVILLYEYIKYRH